MKKHILYILSLLALCIVSCTKPQEETPATQIGLRLEKENASYQADGGRFVYVEANCDWTLALQPVVDGGDVSWASLTATSGSGSKTVVLSYKYNGSEDARSLSVVLTASDGTTVMKGFVQAGISTDPEAPEQRPGWLELPQETSTLTYYNHSFSYDGERYRNYSFGWDSSSRLAQWVAYPLCGFYTKKLASRTEAWSFDPSVPVSQQADLTRSYSGNYDRGHQIPSADRLVCSQANAQTFYFSNMTPQRAAFNQGVWGSIEGTVRGWSEKCDTLYVVTGCVMDGASGSTTDAAGNKCPLPAAYFKAILRYSKSSTYGNSGYNGIGIYLNHSGSYGQALTTDMVMSLSNLEKKLGYSLFVNLDTVLSPETAKRIKSEEPTGESVKKLWGFN